jgi:hypothetical protein
VGRKEKKRKRKETCEIRRAIEAAHTVRQLPGEGNRQHELIGGILKSVTGCPPCIFTHGRAHEQTNRARASGSETGVCMCVCV